MRLRFFYLMDGGNFGAKLLCLFRGHQYGEPAPAEPPWVLVAGCERCHAAARVSMDKDEFARGGYVDADGAALIHDDYTLPPGGGRVGDEA